MLFILSERSKMVAVQRDYWYFMVLVMLLYFKGSVQMKALQSTVTLEEGMVLDCQCPWSGQLTMVSWTKKSLSQPLAVYHPEFGTSFAPSYDGRVEFLKNTPMDGSISIMNVSHSDIGHYHCSLQTYPQGSWTKDTFVANTAISGNSSIETDTELVVAGSDNMTIKCDHIHNGKVYQVTIEQLGDEDVGGVVTTCRMLEDGVETSGRLNCSDALGIRLHLTDVIEDDDGLYRCNFSTDDGVQSTTIRLTTLSAHDISVLQYMLYVYVGAGVLGGAVLMGFVLLVTWVHRRNRKREEYKIKLHPDKRQKWKYRE